MPRYEFPATVIVAADDPDAAKRRARGWEGSYGNPPAVTILIDEGEPSVLPEETEL